MKTKLRVLAALITFLPLGASGQQQPQTIVDLFTCSFVDQSDMDDLLGVVARWSDWADSHGVTGYSAFIMTPWRFPNRGVDVGWFGVWSDGTAMGRTEALWSTDGVELQAKLDAVMDCNARRQFVGVDVVTTAQPPPRISVLALRNCWIDEAHVITDVMEAMRRWAAYFEDRGHVGSQHLLLRFAGSMLEADFDFKVAEGLGSLESYGEFMNIYSSGGSTMANDLFEPLMDCDNRRLYLMERVRSPRQR